MTQVRKACFAFYRAARTVLAPSLKYSQAIYETVLEQHVASGMAWLDLGCGHQLLPKWRREQEHQLAARAGRLVGFDYDADALRRHPTIRDRVRGDVSMLPFRDGTFDLITSNMVFEHLAEPEAQLKEVFRVLRPGGLLVFHTPNKLGYALATGRLIPAGLKVKLAGFLQDRRPEDVYPTFYRVNTTNAIEALAMRVGFRVDELKLIVSSATLIMIPPLVVLELLLLRALMTRPFQRFRTNIIAVLSKPCLRGAVCAPPAGTTESSSQRQARD